MEKVILMNISVIVHETIVISVLELFFSRSSFSVDFLFIDWNEISAIGWMRI